MSDDVVFRSNLLEGISAFHGARSRAFWQEMLAHLRGKPAELLSFDDIKARLRLREESYKGLQDIELDKIVGSVGRYREFTRDFLPKNNKLQERWSRVYAVANSMEGLPPIEVYKVGDVYFVRDGNHRVSVARKLGAKTIQAHVTELPSPVPLHQDISREELDDAVAYADFLNLSGLGISRPHHQTLQLSVPSRYGELLGHILVHKSILEQSQGADLDVEDAAANWYDYVYRPAVTLIRKYKVLDHMPGRTEADLYLWLVDHLRELRAQYGDEAPSRKISDALVDFLAQRRIPIPMELMHEDDPSVILTRTQMMRALELADEGQAVQAVQDEQPAETPPGSSHLYSA